jgi:hypothetical protein
MCRRSHGAGFVTWFGIPTAQLKVLAGADVLVRHHSSDHATRSFCGRCGSSLFFETTKHPEKIDVVLANMDGPIDREPDVHVHFDDRVGWVDVHDSLPRLGGPSGMEPLDP